MASFLNNSGDIILDAVLTDYGRQLLAKGDGSFNITKFAFGDDEIDYQLWDQAAATSLKDTEIMATPILESFTNNAASMKSKLLTIGIENLLYLPILKLNTNIFDTATFNNLFTGFVCPIDNQTNDTTNSITGSSTGFKNAGLLNFTKIINIDQGLDSANLDSRKSLFDELPELYEKEYNIIIDNRLGTIAPTKDDAPIQYISLDDDNMATYKVSETANGNFVQKIKVDGSNPTTDAIILGYQGTRLSFTVKPSKAIENNNVLDRLGEQLNLVPGVPFRTVRSSVKVVGVTTGYSIEIPVLFAKKV
jgi:hypothetical protein